MSIRHGLAVVPNVFEGFGQIIPISGNVSIPAAVDVYTMSPGRITAFVAGVVALIGVVIAVLALVRSVGRISIGNRRRGAMAAMALGVVAVVLGGWVAVTAEGGLGTGNGLGGGVVASILGLIGMLLGGVALRRSADGR